MNNTPFTFKIFIEFQVNFVFFPDLQVRGLTLVRDMPCEESILLTLFNRMGFPKSTHYGSRFSVKAKPQANNLAYTASTLGLHCDLPFYVYNPGK